MNIPENLQYTTDHEWVLISNGEAKVGITDYAQDALGDVVFVDIPATGKVVMVGETVTEVESTKSVSDIYAPLEGEIIKINEELDEKIPYKRINKSLWTQAEGLSLGHRNKIRSIYIHLRFKQLKEGK